MSFQTNKEMGTFKVILAGHEGSKKILALSSYFLKENMDGFDIYFLNYGEYDGKLYCGTYVSLDDEQRGGVKSWSLYISEYLKKLDDEYVIFALDDYLITNKIDRELYNAIELTDCVKLCSTSDINDKEYSCTTQYTIWKKDLLIDILEKVETPWEFEIEGSKYLNTLNKNITLVPVMTYPDYSALSSKWKGIRF